MLRQCPPGTTPPLHHSLQRVHRARSCNLGFSSNTLREQQLFDLGTNFIRTQLATVQGAAMPYPYGGKTARRSWWTSTCRSCTPTGLSPTDVVNAIDTQNLILPAGTAKIGPQEYHVEMNSSPRTGRRT